MDEKKPVQKNENAIEKKKEKQRVCWEKKKKQMSVLSCKLAAL